MKCTTRTRLLKESSCFAHQPVRSIHIMKPAERHLQADADRSEKTKTIAVLTTICLFGLLIRIPWIGYGLPLQFQPDEWACVNVSFKFFTGNFIHHGTYYPTLYMYMVFVAYIIYCIFGLVTGKFAHFSDFYASFYQFGDPYLDYGDPVFFTIARFISAVCFSCAVFIVGMHIRKNYSFRIAVVISVILLLLPWEYVYSRYAVTESLLIATILTALCMIDRFLRKPGPASWYLACFTALLACSSKQPGMLVTLSLTAGYIFAARKLPVDKNKRIRMIAIGAVILAAGYCIINPGMVFSGNRSLIDVLIYMYNNFNFMKGPALSPAGTTGPHDPWWSYPVFLLKDYGPLLLLLCTGGMVHVIYRRQEMHRHVPWAVFFFTYLLVMQLTGIKVDRYVLPISSVAVVWLLPEVLMLIESRVKKRIATIVMVLACLYPAYRIIDYYLLWAAGDTRMHAAQWLSRQQLDYRCIARELHFTPHIPVDFTGEKIEPWSMGQYSIEALEKKKVGLLIISDDARGMADNKPVMKKNYQEFEKKLERVAHFSGRRKFGYYNPEVIIYRVPDTSGHVSR